MDRGPRVIQFLAPYLPVPMIRVRPSMPMAAAAMSQRICRARSRSRRNTPSTTKRASPSSRATNCLSRAEGAEEAVTARERVERKKAMISISKPTRRSARMAQK